MGRHIIYHVINPPWLVVFNWILTMTSTESSLLIRNYRSFRYDPSPPCRTGAESVSINCVQRHHQRWKGRRRGVVWNSIFDITTGPLKRGVSQTLWSRYGRPEDDLGCDWFLGKLSACARAQSASQSASQSGSIKPFCFCFFCFTCRHIHVKSVSKVRKRD